MVRQLRKFYHKVCAENNEVLSLREDIAKFTVKLTNAQTSLKVSLKINKINSWFVSQYCMLISIHCIQIIHARKIILN